MDTFESFVGEKKKIYWEIRGAPDRRLEDGHSVNVGSQTLIETLGIRRFRVWEITDLSQVMKIFGSKLS